MPSHSETNLSIPHAIPAFLLVNTLSSSSNPIANFTDCLHPTIHSLHPQLHISHEKDTPKMSSPLPPFNSSNKKPIYDLSPFLSSTTITSLRPGEQPDVLQIPETLIASPLAANLAPADLIDIREVLTGESFPGARGGGGGGNGVWKGAGSEIRDRGKGKGEEIWRAWKRAWDVWNGYYIEGRVDEGFIRKEYEEIKQALEVQRERERVSGYRTGVEIGDEDGDDSGQGPFSNPVWRGTPPVPRLKDPEEVVKEDGSTGGFIPMKLLPEYRAPETDGAGNHPEGWEDVLANSVWRPRRVGEREGEGEVRVGIDGDWGGKSEFEVDGGVDCGRSPYPVRISPLFRSLTTPLFGVG